MQLIREFQIHFGFRIRECLKTSASSGHVDAGSWRKFQYTWFYLEVTKRTGTDSRCFMPGSSSSPQQGITHQAEREKVPCPPRHKSKEDSSQELSQHKEKTMSSEVLSAG
jgi:hypothetical protein